MGWENLLGYMFSYLFTQYKVVKGKIFMIAFQKNKLNLVHVFIFICNLFATSKKYFLLKQSIKHYC